jgi:hypothetical protein
MGVLSIVVGAAAVVSLYVTAFPPDGVRNVGADANGYVVQIKAARLGILDLQATRPGVGATGAVLAGAGLTPPNLAPILLSIVIAVSLGLTAGVAVRSAYRLPGWSTGIIALMVATWSGTFRLASGYLANLLSLALFVLFLALSLARGRDRPSLPLVAVAIASLFAHPPLLPAYAAIVVGWGLASALRSPRGDPPLDRRSEAISATLALVLGAAVVVGVLGAWMGLRTDDLVDIEAVRAPLGARAVPPWLNPPITMLAIGSGSIVAFLLRRGRSAAVAARLGIPWLALAMGGVLAPVLLPGFPGNRTLLLGVPAPMLGGLAVAGGAHVFVTRFGVGRGRSVVRVAAVGIVASVALGVAVFGQRPFHQQVSGPRAGVRSGASAVVGYLRSIGPRRPVVMVADPRSDRGLRSLKALQNTVRALAPEPIFLQIVTYLGDERNLLQGVPTRRTGDGAAAFNAAATKTWLAVRSQLDDDPIILVVRSWVPGSTWQRVADRAAPGDPDIAVVRGPVPRGDVPFPQEPHVSRSEAAIRISSALLLLGLLGGGWSAAAPTGRWSTVDATGLAPAFGLCLVVLVGIGIALLGGEPGGVTGLAAVGVAGAVGWVAAWRKGNARRSEGAALQEIGE